MSKKNKTKRWPKGKVHRSCDLEHLLFVVAKVDKTLRNINTSIADVQDVWLSDTRELSNAQYCLADAVSRYEQDYVNEGYYDKDATDKSEYENK